MSLPVMGRAFNAIGGHGDGQRIGIIPMQYPFVVYTRDRRGLTGPVVERHEDDGDKGFWLMFARANAVYGPALIPWPCEPVIDCITNSFPSTENPEEIEWVTPDGYTRERLAEDAAANEAMLMGYEYLSDYPRVDRVAIVGRAPSSNEFIDGSPLRNRHTKGWEPNLSIYLNWTPDKAVRRHASRSSQRWLMVMDRRVKANVLDGVGADGSAGEFLRWDGLFVSLAADPGLIAEAMRRKIPIIALDYREGPVGFYRKGFNRVRHFLGCGPMALLLVGQGTAKQAKLGVPKIGSLLIAGLDGNQRGVEIPDEAGPEATEDERKAAHLKRLFQIDQVGQYFDLGTASAGIAFYLDQCKVPVHHMAGKGTPYHVATVGLTQSQVDVVRDDIETPEKTEAQ